jgi:fatty acid desaturase
MGDPVQRALPPRPPSLTEREQRQARVRDEARRTRGRREQRSLLRGLILLALLVLLVSLARAGFGRLFVPGWWSQW